MLAGTQRITLCLCLCAAWFLHLYGVGGSKNVLILNSYISIKDVWLQHDQLNYWHFISHCGSNASSAYLQHILFFFFFVTPLYRPSKYGRIISYPFIGFKIVQSWMQSPFSEAFEHLTFLFRGCAWKINTGPAAGMNWKMDWFSCYNSLKSGGTEGSNWDFPFQLREQSLYQKMLESIHLAVMAYQRYWKLENDL